MRRNARERILGEVRMKYKAVIALSFLLMTSTFVVILSARAREEGMLLPIPQIDVVEISNLLRDFLEILFIWPERFFGIQDEGLIILLSWASISIIAISIWQIVEAW